MAAIYAVYTSPTHPPIPNHLPTLIVTPHGNAENYLLTPSPQGDLCVAKLFPPRPKDPATKGSASDPGHSSSSSRIVRCEASRNLKWSIANTGVISPIYKLSLPSPDSPDLPLFQRIEFGKIQKNPPGPNGGGTRISITGKTPEEKAVWQTLGEGNEDCVEWVVLCAALNLLDDEIMKAADKNPGGPPPAGPVPVSLRDPGTWSGPRSRQRPRLRPSPAPTDPSSAPRLAPGPGPGGAPMQMQRPPPGPNGPPNGPPMQQGPPPMQQVQGGPRPPPGFAPGQRPPPGPGPGPGGQPMPMRNGTMPPPGPGQPGGMPMQQQRPPPGPGGQAYAHARRHHAATGAAAAGDRQMYYFHFPRI
ncbi:hypothetical protein B0H14DRAFT_3078881 [Mycena olivaceomarginata]|nr:hypothetical protein B0H14DRAFT_3078881 [Mycena olivaceomarginata]